MPEAWWWRVIAAAVRRVVAVAAVVLLLPPVHFLRIFTSLFQDTTISGMTFLSHSRIVLSRSLRVCRVCEAYESKASLSIATPAPTGRSVREMTVTFDDGSKKTTPPAVDVNAEILVTHFCIPSEAENLLKWYGAGSGTQQYVMVAISSLVLYVSIFDLASLMKGLLFPWDHVEYAFDLACVRRCCLSFHIRCAKNAPRPNGLEARVVSAFGIKNKADTAAQSEKYVINLK